MSDRAHVLVILVTALTLLFILRLVRHRQMRAKYAMLWLLVGMALLVLAIAPWILEPVSRAVGIAYPPAMFLLVAIAFLFVVVVHFSWELSRLEDRSRKLAEELALLRTELARRDVAEDADAAASVPTSAVARGSASEMAREPD